MHNKIDLSVIIATYNRAEILRQTLENMTVLERDGLSVEFVVVDNNSSDHTKEVIESFIDRLPIRYLFEPRPGKNCALNKALNEVSLGEIVVFTDDDVKPREDWLRNIYEVSQRRKEFSVFGGRIYIIWPNQEVPKWIRQNHFLRASCYGEHLYGMEEMAYKENISVKYPFGANLWFRLSLLSERRYNDQIGPHPRKRIIGSETSLLMELEKEGYEMLYVPQALVGHYVTKSQLSERYLLKRAYFKGKSVAFFRNMEYKYSDRSEKMEFYMMRPASLLKHCCRLLLARMYFSREAKFSTSADALKWMGFNMYYLTKARRT